ncbi:MAG: hypothetical protein LBI87_05180 [Candidatus Accumulibacter sp.]|nr:hypothetical protein [Accumulibacter sp.]
MNTVLPRLVVAVLFLTLAAFVRPAVCADESFTEKAGKVGRNLKEAGGNAVDAAKEGAAEVYGKARKAGKEIGEKISGEDDTK